MADLDHIPKSIAIIDDDELIRNLVSNYASVLGVVNIDCYPSGEEFWSACLKGKKYDLLILDWKLPGLNGVGLFNRLRVRTEFKLLPILVISGFLNKDDFALLDEYPCTSLLEKPFTKALLEGKLIQLGKEGRWYAEKEEAMVELANQFRDDAAGVVKTLKKAFKDSPRPIPLAIIAAKQLRKREFYKEAKVVLEMVIKRDHNCIMAMSELGKVLYLMGKPAEAREILRFTNRLSPENVKRLCLLGEVELNLQEPESARKYFESALEIDPEDRIASSGAIVAKNVENHIVEYSKNSIPQNFASLLNIIGVTKIRSGAFQDGIDQYKAALAFLTADDVVAKVAFNLGLGFLRWDKPEMALPWFVKSAEAGKGNFSKSTYYINRIAPDGHNIDASISSGGGLPLISEIDDSDISEAMDISPSVESEDKFEITPADDFLGGIESMDLGELEAFEEDDDPMNVKTG